MIRSLVSVAIILAGAGQAQAWSEAGHRITGSIAFHQLTPDAQAKIVAILKQHPRFADDFQTPDDACREPSGAWNRRAVSHFRSRSARGTY